MKYPRQIYAIQHNVTKRIYIGSSANVDKRYLNHIYRLRGGKHNVEDMQRDFYEYGEDFSVYILDEITEYKELNKEYQYMQKYNSLERGIGYNYLDNIRNRKRAKLKIPYKSGLPITNLSRED